MDPAALGRQPSRSDCNRAIKILTQYERLTAKFGKRLSPGRIAELDRLRHTGQITIEALPAFLRREWPGGPFDQRNLNEIRALCGMNQRGKV